MFFSISEPYKLATLKENIFLVSLTRNQREVHMFHLTGEAAKILTCSCWEKDNFILISEFKYAQTWKTWPSPLSLSLYSIFNTWFKLSSTLSHILLFLWVLSILAFMLLVLIPHEKLNRCLVDINRCLTNIFKI